MATGHVQQSHNSVTMHASDALCGADGMTLNQELQAENHLGTIQTDRFLILDESSLANVAPIPLIAQFIFTEAAGFA
jgi:hypothetical protein